MPIKNIKRCSISSIIDKCNLKLQGDTTTHLWELLILERLFMPSSGDDIDELLLSYTADRNLKRYYHFRKVWRSFIAKLTHLLYDPAISLLGLPKKKLKYMSIPRFYMTVIATLFRIA